MHGLTSQRAWFVPPVSSLVYISYVAKAWLFTDTQDHGITAKFVTVSYSMSVVSNSSCSHFFGQWSYWGYTHALCRYARTYLPKGVICTACEQPTLVCHGPQLPCERWLELSSFLGLPSCQRRVLAVALHQCDNGLGISCMHEGSLWRYFQGTICPILAIICYRFVVTTCSRCQEIQC